MFRAQITMKEDEENNAMSDSKEQAFLATLQEITERAKENGGSVSEEDLSDAFKDLHLDAQQMQQVRSYLASQKIGVGGSLPYEDVITQDEHNYLDDYEKMIAGIEKPSEGVMEATKISAMAGERDAQEQVVSWMLDKVVDIAKLYAGQGVFMEDLIGAGNEELSRSVRLMAPLEGPQEVDGFLASRVMDAMEALVREAMENEKQDKAVENLCNLVNDKANELAGELGRKVTPLELAAEGDVTMDQIMDAIKWSGNKIENIDYQG